MLIKFGKKELNLMSKISIEIRKIYGFGLFVSFLTNRFLGLPLINKENINKFYEDKIFAFIFLLQTNYIFERKANIYQLSSKIRFLSFDNFKRVRYLRRLSVRGQRTQTNNNTNKRLSLISFINE